jgi:hypothetical protein
MNPTDPILQRLRQLVLERQELRDAGGSREQLESNRLAIVEEQWRLARAAFETYGRHDESKAA